MVQGILSGLPDPSRVSSIGGIAIRGGGDVTGLDGGPPRRASPDPGSSSKMDENDFFDGARSSGKEKTLASKCGWSGHSLPGGPSRQTWASSWVLLLLLLLLLDWKLGTGAAQIGRGSRIGTLPGDPLLPSWGCGVEPKVEGQVQDPGIPPEDPGAVGIGPEVDLPPRGLRPVVSRI